ncbi:hypothetical protein PRIPAC_78849 [Pristionchus pacificus]|uniref:Membrane transporter n=1 Tax=Pristionchus pacificus TaxID=54126 RepID=A0A2A6CMP9_PRIPA|nr:hypothetical protein PRIPAC_78849 [Pristionchus pacificus]|eukprot:PDM79472.1 membrane transporter [Pristionchus pacificus]
MLNLHMLSMSIQIAFSCMGSLGFATTFLNTPVEEFKEYLNASYGGEMTSEGYNSLWNWIQNSWLLGFFIGMLLSPLLNDRYGRKGRFFSSIASAIAFQSIVLYLQEFPPNEHRGASSYTSDIIFSFFCFVGMTLGTEQLLGDNLSLLMIVQVLICGISVLVTVRLHESPKCLLIKKNDEAATRASIRFFWGTEHTPSEEEEESSSAQSFKDIVTIFTDPALRKTLLLGLAAVEMTVPLWMFLFNSTDLLLDLNTDKMVSQWTSSGMVIGYFIGSIIGSNLIDRIGRRLLFIPASAIATACIGLVTAAFYLKPIVPHSEYIAVGAMLLYGFIYGTGIGSIAWFIAAELSPQRYRSLIQSTVAAVNTIQSATFTFAVMPLYRLFGAWVFLVLFCLVCTICNVYLYWYLPETKGRPIADVTDEIRTQFVHLDGAMRPDAIAPPPLLTVPLRTSRPANLIHQSQFSFTTGSQSGNDNSSMPPSPSFSALDTMVRKNYISLFI